MTPRQRLLLKAIIQEFMDTANAVGSLNLPDKYRIKASPATIRNEMARLVKLGYLSQPHSSSGRVPTNYGLKYYLKELMDELEDIDYTQEAQLKEELHQKRFNKRELIQSALQYLARNTKNTALAIIEDNVFYSGLSDMLDIPEFQELGHLKNMLSIIENYSTLYNLFKRYSGSNDIKVLIGEETEIEGFNNYAVIFTEIKIYNNESGYLCVIGPNRMNYRFVLPAMKTVANNIESVVKGW